MAENDQRAYRDPLRRHSAEEAPRAQADDPLAELARLIGQSVPMNKLGQDRRAAAPESTDDRRGEADHAASYPAPDAVLREPTEDRHSAPEVEQYERDVDPDYRERRDERFEPMTRVNPAPPSRASRFRQEPDFPMEPARDAADGGAGEADEVAHHETADSHDRLSDERDSHYSDEYYEDERHDADDHAYGDEYSGDQNTGRRGGFIFVAAVFTLAVLGTAGAFAYRAMFSNPVLPALPPIIKAEGGPNKLIPSGVGSRDSAAREADANNAASPERLVSREERPVDIPPPATSTAPRPVSTVPVFPDPPPMGSPGVVVGYSARPTSSNPAMSTESPAPTAPAMTTATASNPAASASQASPPAAAPTVSTATPATPGVPAAPGPKKIRTVTIRADQSGAPDAVAGSSPSVPGRPGTQSPQGSNGPLSIVPSSAEASAAPARPRPAPAQPVPLNKPPANETASASPVAAPVATGGGYTVQVSSQRSEEEAQSSFRDLQAKYPNVLGGRAPIIRRADLGAKGIFFRTMVGPFASADEATELCSNLKAAGGSCLVQKN
ncbi:MAG TPA: SPOR domain-containing protein [Xanthobacteraceae bacterium]|nr:SPOR domain-containing protein [Xanthobacteraceae bacterium]